MSTNGRRVFLAVKLLTCAVLVSMCMGGCPNQFLIVRLWPGEAGLERSVEAITTESSETMAVLALASNPSSRQSTTWRFADDTGGGAGYFLQIKTSMGQASLYLERFGGHTDLLAQVQDRLAATDELVDHLVRWFALELEGKPGWPRLRQFLGGKLRHDLKNLTLYLWRTGSRAIEPGDALPVLCYLLEHEYLVPEDLAVAGRMIQGSQPTTRSALVAARHKLARWMDVAPDAPEAAALDFLTEGRLEASLRAYAQAEGRRRGVLGTAPTTAAATQATADFEERLGEEVGAAAKRVSGVDQLINISFGGGADSVLVTMAGRIPATMSNGEWNPELRAMVWRLPRVTPGTQASHPATAPRPAYAYALNIEPNEAFQRRHFGKIVLDGQNLALYCLWHRGLNKDQARQWDAFLEGLRPTPELAERLAAFRFADERDVPEADRRAAATTQKIGAGLSSETQPASGPS